ncbi:hypothetical protein J2857_003590 [Neorhizobium galegae]|uniref:hypothetical protein n=1 Tax=Neorhizobium galegae TaxID=399 RepID=UPI001AE7F7D1|nr:hypothetical protein [Neorhizobium galegae]MBP2560821.1 hypothetical protein [Neorhizobium galegae]
MKSQLMVSVALAASVVPAWAGFGSWSVEIEDDPFSGGRQVAVSISTSIRSGVLILCDSSKDGVVVRAIPGFAFNGDISGFVPSIEIAIDGKRLISTEGETGSVGDNLAISQVSLSVDDTKIFVDAFAKAKKQVAIKDGISDRPHLMAANGTTKAGTALRDCLARQPSSKG